MFFSEVMRGWYYPREMEPHQVLFSNHQWWNIKNKHFSLMWSITVEVWIYNYRINFDSTEIWSHFSTVFVFFFSLKMCLSHGQVMSKFYTSELNFYLSQAIVHRFWCTLHFSLMCSLTVSNSPSSQHIYFHLPFRLGSYLAFWTAVKTLFFFLWGLQIAEHRTPGLLKLSSR